MANKFVKKNVDMRIFIPSTPPQKTAEDMRYIKIPLLKRKGKRYGIKIDRSGIVYQLIAYFTIVNGIQSTHWFLDSGVLARLSFVVANFAAIFALVLILQEWVKTHRT